MERERECVLRIEKETKSKVTGAKVAATDVARKENETRLFVSVSLALVT